MYQYSDIQDKIEQMRFQYRPIDQCTFVFVSIGTTNLKYTT